MPHIEDVFEYLKRDDASESIKGKRAEKFVQKALSEHPGLYGQERFDGIWLWKDWPAREKHGYDSGDIGIDLVAKDKNTGQWVAIQVKSGRKMVTTKQIDSFMGAFAAPCFESALLVTRSDIQKIGREKLDKSEKCAILRTSEMDTWVTDWRVYIQDPSKKLPINIEHHELRGYQEDAVDAIVKGFTGDNKGKLIMPCGSGKSLVALRAAEEVAGVGRDVLYLVPSIALVSQTMREWSNQKRKRIEYMAICSDATVGRKATDDSSTAGNLSELMIPPTTNTEDIIDQLSVKPKPGHMRVIFSTYHSTPKIAKALEKLPNFHFELAICDEAHRTTGIQEAEAKSTEAGYRGTSPFQLIHQNEYLRASKRLFMTATPRIFTSKQRKKLDEGTYDDNFSYSMDDPDSYGEEFYKLTFADALEENCLSDYEVIVIAADKESYLQTLKSYSLQHSNPAIKDDIDTDTAVKLAGSWDALATPQTTKVDPDRKPGQINHELGQPARAAIAFCNTVRSSEEAKEHWQAVADTLSEGYTSKFLHIDVNHIDANTPSNKRVDLLHWLRGSQATSVGSSRPGTLLTGAELRTPSENDEVCRILSNAKVLSEGVDVPALDAVVFLEPRSSELEITQAVGRVMRKAEGKEKGYVVIPVVVPQYEFSDDNEADRENFIKGMLNSSDFKAVWQVARALRSHDERIDYWLNNPQTAKAKGKFKLRTTTFKQRGADSDGSDQQKKIEESFRQLSLALSDRFSSALVERCGDKNVYPAWGEHAARICETIRQRVNVAIARREEFDNPVADAFDLFLEEIRESISPEVDARQAEEMIAQHIVTIPVFNALFAKSEFASKNPVSISINKLIDVMESNDTNFSKELKPLKRAYETMERAFKGAVSSEQKLDILREIYDGFFKTAMKKTVAALGVVYTPVELIDFIWRSVDAVCRQEFGKGLTDENVNILEPFAGTGTFISRLITGRDADGNHFIRDEDLARKYADEIHANEIILLAYYIAALKIEEMRHSRQPKVDESEVGVYEPYQNMVLTNTFLMGRDRDARITGLFPNVERVLGQNQIPINVIATNPPWTAGQKSASDDNPRPFYDAVAQRVQETYTKEAEDIPNCNPGAASGNAYVLAFRWATDRILQNSSKTEENTSPKPAIIAFVSPNSLYNATSLAGMRKCMQKEFTDIYIVNLRGDAYKAGEERRLEGDVIFGAGSRNGVQITVLVYNPGKESDQPAEVHYAEVPERSKLQEKLAWLNNLGNVLDDQFVVLPQNSRWSWSNPGGEGWEEMTSLCPKKSGEKGDSISTWHAQGIKTNCDPYVYAFSRKELTIKVQALIKEYNRTLERYIADESAGNLGELTKSYNKDKIKWTESLKRCLKKKQFLVFDELKITSVLYRPFRKMWLYLDTDILDSTSVLKFFPTSELGGASDGLAGGGGHSRTASQGSPIRSTRNSTDHRHVRHQPHTQILSKTTSDIDVAGGGASSSSSAIKSSSGFSQPDGYQIYTPQDEHQGPSAADFDQRSVGSTENSRHGNAGDARSTFDRTWASDKGTLSICQPIAITSTTNRAVFSLLATKYLLDLCGVGTNQPSYAITPSNRE